MVYEHMKRRPPLSHSSCFHRPEAEVLLEMTGNGSYLRSGPSVDKQIRNIHYLATKYLGKVYNASKCEIKPLEGMKGQ